LNRRKPLQNRHDSSPGNGFRVLPGHHLASLDLLDEEIRVVQHRIGQSPAYRGFGGRGLRSPLPERSPFFAVLHQFFNRFTREYK